MKKLYLAGVVFLISLLAVSAGEYPDEDMDGWCESPFCDKLDNCPKIACEQLGLPIEGCLNPELNKDSDGDGAGDGCDECPQNPSIIVLAPGQTCAPPRRPGGGSGGAGGEEVCGACKGYVSNVVTDQYQCCSGTPQAVGSLCGMLLDSINRGIPMPAQCGLLSQTGAGPLTGPLTIPQPYGEAATEQPTLAEQQRPVQVDYRRVEAPRPPVPVRQTQVAQPDTSWLPALVILGVLIAAAVYYLRRQR